MGDRPKVTNG